MSVGSVTIIGPGRMGLTLAGAFHDAGTFREVVVAGRHPAQPDVPGWDERSRYVFGVERPTAGSLAVLLAVPDAEVPEVAHALAGLGRAPEGCAVFHLSGTLPTDVLEPLYHAGYVVGALHPLLAVADPGIGRHSVGDAWFSVTGAPDAVSVARVLVNSIGSRLITVPAARRSTYHAAAVLASTMMLPLLARAVELMQRAGVNGDDGLAALIPLVRSTLDSIEAGEVPEALRGPIACGDVDTVALHLRALDDDEARLYATIGAEALALSRGSLDPGVSQALDDLFSRYLHLETTETGY
jgi:predicted short-subunit dehydrogenase-like oxidoreductase (DUF2520 family)